MMKYIIPLLLIIPAWAFAQGRAPVFTLEQCLTAADAHLPLAQQVPLIEAAHRAALAQLRNNYLPQASLNAQATWQTAVTSVPIKLPGIEIASISKDQYKATLEVSQYIWDGGQNAGLTAVQKAQTETELQRVQVDRYTAREQTMQLYCAALLAQKQSDMLTALKKDIAQRRLRIAEQVSNGTAIPANVQVFEARLLELEQQEEEARARKASAIDGIALLTGLPVQTTDSLSVPVVANTENNQNNRPELTLFTLQQRTTQAQERVIQSKTMPRVNAIATLGYGRPGLNFLDNDFSPYGIFGVNARWNLHPLYTGSASKERQQVRIQSQRIEVQRAQFLLQSNVRQQQQVRDIERLRQVLERDKKIIVLRDNITATAGVQLENGVLTPSEYLIESTNAASARLNTSIHEIQLLQAQMQLLFINGNL